MLKKFNVKDKVALAVETNDRSAILKDRVGADFVTAVHIDTDEASEMGVDRAIYGKLLSEALDTDELNGEETIPDTAVDVEEQAIQSVMVECLHKVLTLLSEDERWLVDKLYFQGISQSDLEKESGISQQVISYRNKVVLRKLENLIKK